MTGPEQTSTTLGRATPRWDVMLAAQEQRDRVVRRVRANGSRGLSESMLEDLYDNVAEAAARPIGRGSAYPHPVIEAARFRRWMTTALRHEAGHYAERRVARQVSIDGLQPGQTVERTLTQDAPDQIIGAGTRLAELIQAMPDERARTYFLLAYVQDVTRGRLKARYGWSDAEIKWMRSQVGSVLRKARSGALALIPPPLWRLRARRLGLEVSSVNAPVGSVREQLIAAGAASGTGLKLAGVSLLAAGAVASAGVGLVHTIAPATTRMPHHPRNAVRDLAPSRPAAASSAPSLTTTFTTAARSTQQLSTHTLSAGAPRVVHAEDRELQQARVHAREQRLLHSSLGALAVGAPASAPANANTTASAASAPTAHGSGVAENSSSALAPVVARGGGSNLDYLGGGS